MDSPKKIVLRGFSASAMIFLLGLATPDAFPQVPLAPWEQRIQNCLGGKQPKEAICDRDMWPNAGIVAARVNQLYLRERYELLDLLMAGAVESKVQFEEGGSPAEIVYGTFRQMILAPGASEADSQRIQLWRQAMPGSPYAEFARARFAYASAWNIRGNQAGSSVSRESWELFNIRLREAEQILFDAPQKLKDTPLWHQLLMAVTMDMREPKVAPRAIFDEAIKRWPRHFAFYELALTRMAPRWGGSWELVEASISEWSKRLNATEGTSLYARLYVSLLNQANMRDTAMDWGKMKPSLDDLVARYPAPSFRNLRASYACYAQDKAAFTEALLKLPTSDLESGKWLPGHTYEACMRWAGV